MRFNEYDEYEYECDLHTSKARYELKVVLLYTLAGKMTRLVPGFIWMHLAISS